jgi:uncharacterized membrane protein
MAERRATRGRAKTYGGPVARTAEPAHPLERLIFFSDAVFAIAITLLIVEISIPHLQYGADDSAHLLALAERIPHFMGFFLSFAVIGAFWAGHHRAFSMARHYGPGLIFPNLAMLCAVAFMPFATAYMSANFAQAVPSAFYNAVMFVTGLLNLRLVRKVTGAPFVAEDADAVEIAVTRARGWGVPLGAAVAFAMCFVVPQIAQFMLISIPLWIALAVRAAKRRVARAGA